MSEEKKNPIPVGPGESVSASPGPASSLANLLKGGATALRGAIVASGHDNWNRAMGVKAGAEADMALEAAKAAKQGLTGVLNKLQPPSDKKFRRGDTVYDEERGIKGTIVEIHASQTKKTHTPAHRIVGKGGKEWLQREDWLRKA